MKIDFKICLLFLTFYVCSASFSLSAETLLKKYNIKGDGKTLTTKAIQNAIDDCSQKGGGIISLPKGEYLTGTLILKDNVILKLEKGAVISGSKNIADYPAIGRRKALIFAEKVNNISIVGEGQINGNGSFFNKGNDAPDRPTLVLLFDCNKVNVTGVKLLNSGFWTFRFVRCDSVNIHHINVNGHANWNNDGLDIESRNVTISDCIIDTDDDAICFKSEDPEYIVENISVKNCNLASNCNYIKFGTASAGGFRNIKVFDCTLHKCSQSLFRFWEKRVPGVTNPITGISGIALEVVDGGFLENITVSNIKMEDVQSPIFIRLGKRKVSDNSYLKNILIQNIKASSVSYVASSITGVPDLNVENITIKDIDLKLKAGGKASDTVINVPEMKDSYPENRMFGVILPAYGFYIRHANHIFLEDIKLSAIGGNEERHVIYADDVNGLEITKSMLQSPSGNKSIVHLKSCKDIKLLHNICSDPTSVFFDNENTAISEIKYEK